MIKVKSILSTGKFSNFSFFVGVSIFEMVTSVIVPMEDKELEIIDLLFLCVVCIIMATLSQNSFHTHSKIGGMQKKLVIHNA